MLFIKAERITMPQAAKPRHKRAGAAPAPRDYGEQKRRAAKLTSDTLEMKER